MLPKQSINDVCRFVSVTVLLCLLCLNNWQALGNQSFLAAIQGKLQYIPKPEDGIKHRLLKEYGALWLTDREAKLPPKIAFDSADESKNYQQTLKLKQVPATNCLLQETAALELEKAMSRAAQLGLKISPKGNDACLRNYEMTHQLWLSRLEPNLNYYVSKGRLSALEANVIRKAPIWKQVEMVLELEKKKGLLFDKFRKTSILNSVAAPGSSQHLSGLAFDLAEFEDARTRKLMNEFGWFQTVKDDLPHFTYLGHHKEKTLIEKGLKKVVSGAFVFWVPDL